MLLLQKIKNYWIEIALFVITFCYFAFLCQERLITRDEGYYLYASQLVAEGQKPYLNFFYPQMPLLPNLYSLIFKFFGASWENARLLNAFFATALGIAIFRFVKLKLSFSYAMLAILLYLTSNYTIAWLSVSQTYAPSLLCLLISFYYLSRGSLTRNDVMTAGAFLAYAIQIRLFFLAILPIYLGKLLFSSKSHSEKLKNLVYFSLMMIIFSLPTIYIAFTNWDIFYFNNLGYHLERTNLTSAEIIANKIQVALVALGLTPTVKFSAWQLPILIYYTLVSSAIVLLKQRTLPLAFILMVSLFILNLLPDPAYVQYFATLLPFAIIGTVTLIYLVPKKSVKIILTVSLLAVYFYQLPEDYLRHLKTGKNLIGIMTQEQANHYNLKNIKIITKKLNEVCDAKQEIIGLWPGYLVGTSCRAYHGTENHFGIQIADKLSSTEQAKYSVISNQRIEKAISEQQTPLVILGKREENNRKLRQLLTEAEYQSFWRGAGVELFTKRFHTN